MKRLTTFIFSLIPLALCAAPMSLTQMRQAAQHYLLSEHLIETETSLQLAETFMGSAQDTCFCVFNVDQRGFVIVSADDRCAPILGCSMSGAYRRESMPQNMLLWLEDYRTSIDSGIRSNAPYDKETHKAWDTLLQGYSKPADAKAVSHLLQSTWSQGWGYNNLCPVYQGSHVVVGCVATAMSQVIRYYGYPEYGFGTNQYDTYYGMQSADFGHTHYNYSLMPNELGYGSTSAQITAVATLCYHCGVAVNMIYENPNHTTGSGAYTEDVPRALYHFGYFTAEVRRLIADSVAQWKTALRQELDGGHPLIYSGNSTEGGHAFVCDGYKDNQDLFHFNWGWGGSGDGDYTLTTMQGFTSAQKAIFNMRPSGISSQVDRYCISPDGTGNGSSWQDCSSDYTNIFAAAQYISRPVWMLEGTYSGNTHSDYAFTVPQKVTIYGSMCSTDTTPDQRDILLHPTIIDGQHSRGALYAEGGNDNTSLNDLVIMNGQRSSQAVYTGRCTQLVHCILHDNQVDSGDAIMLYSSNVERCIMYNNIGTNAVNASWSNLHECLIANNHGNGVATDNRTTLLNCDIVRNYGTGIVMADTGGTIRNNIIWGNQEAINRDDAAHLTFCALETAYNGSGNIVVGPNNETDGPRFMAPSPLCGYDAQAADRNWRLAPSSPCIDKADSNRNGISKYDLDGNARRHHGRVDMGCYEALEVGILAPQASLLHAYPNPTYGPLSIPISQDQSAQLYDATGRHLATMRGPQADLSAYPAGSYLLVVEGHPQWIIKQ